MGTGLGRLLEGGHRAARARVAEALLRRVRHRGTSSTACSASSSPGCWCAIAFPASGSSMRWSICRSRCRPRSPASRSPRSTRGNGWIGGPLAKAGIKIAYTPLGVIDRADLHRPAVRRAHAAAGAADLQPRLRGSRRDAWRDALPDLPPRDPADAGADACSPAPRWPSRARSANTAR